MFKHLAAWRSDFEKFKASATITLSDDRPFAIAFLDKDLTIHAIKLHIIKPRPLLVSIRRAVLTLFTSCGCCGWLVLLSLSVFGGSGEQPLFEGTPRSAVSLKTTDDSDVISSVSVELGLGLKELVFVLVNKKNVWGSGI